MNSQSSIHEKSLQNFVPAVACALFSLTSACTATPFVAPNPLPEGQADKFYDVNPIRDVDMVFMVDNSGSMKNKQDKLRKNFPALIKAMRKIPGGLPNLHIGIISSDVGAGNVFISGNPACNRPGGDKGEFQVKTGCGLDATAGNFIITLNNDTMKNYTGTLEDVFSCMAELGERGCGYEHQLQSVRVALAQSVTPKNSGFLRPDAYLAIVMITDEDDCSGTPTSSLFSDTSFTDQTASLRCNLEGHVCNGQLPPTKEFSTPLVNCMSAPKGVGRLIPVDEIISFVKALKKDPQHIIVSAITGIASKPEGAQYSFVRDKEYVDGPSVLDIAPICSAGVDGTAAPAIRISEFVKSFGDNGTLESICDADYSPALDRLGQLIALRLDPGCISDRLIDTDPQVAGIQADCVVTDRVPNNNTTGGYDDKGLPQCGGGVQQPCWNLQAPGATGNTCGASQFRMSVDRGNKEAPRGTIQSIKCRSCATDTDSRCM